ncbi:EthD domain-containing protein [Frigoriglobus tundricola]|uniref:EthD domain-containing protein n=1 Tax=Frigoriglobus tundricola TaxID=2774151 RepID=A0A6M5YV13_9BACT|nr:EthD domain-containing protein [Frigoriglobus tundricola]QJW96732.1 hypothetical protein FTUN_4291 [Frigoriglobus tundricola]
MSDPSPASSGQPSAADPTTDLRHRPPHRSAYASTGQPLIVTPTFVARADVTPATARPRDAGFNLDADGSPMDGADGPPAIEADPNLAFEHWDEYWRKVHGPKFAYEEPGASTEAVLRYDQLHRLPAGPSSTFRPPYRAMVRPDHLLVDDAYARVPAYDRPRWDGLAYIAYGSEADMKAVLGQSKYTERVIADEKTAFRMVTRNVAREHIILPSPAHRDPISLVKIHRRAAHVTREAFQARWLAAHADLVLSRPATHRYVRRYAQLHYIGSTQDDPAGGLMDGITVMAFGSVNDVEDYLTAEDYRAIETDEAALTDAGLSEFWTAVNYSVINRLYPEVSTDRRATR